MSKVNYEMFLDSLKHNPIAVHLAFTSTPFVPNWKRNGLSSKEAAIKHIIKYLKETMSWIGVGMDKTTLTNGLGETLIENTEKKPKKEKKDLK